MLAERDDLAAAVKDLRAEVETASAGQRAADDFLKEEAAQRQVLAAEQTAHSKTRQEAAALQVQLSALEGDNAKIQRLLTSTQKNLQQRSEGAKPPPPSLCALPPF